MLDKFNDKYYCFDTIELTSYFCQSDAFIIAKKCINLYRNIPFSQNDIKTLKKINIKKIYYFCG